MPQDVTVSEAVINQLSLDAYTTASEKGFWDGVSPWLAELNTKLMLIVSEVAEAMEVARLEYEGALNTSGMSDHQEADFIEELADIVIRTFDLANVFTDEFGHIVLKKMRKNAGRPIRHGKRY